MRGHTARTPETTIVRERRGVRKIAVRFALFVGVLLGIMIVSPTCSTKVWDLSRPVPGGDVDHFAPLAHLDEIASYAGNDARLVQLHASGVRDDGTVDLDADDEPRVQYRFVRRVDDGIDYVSVDVWRPGELRTKDRRLHVGDLGDSVVYRHAGMERGVPSAPEKGELADLPKPKCDPKKLWNEAKKRGADADDVAIVTWDAHNDVTHFWIDGTDVKLDVDASCAPR